MPAKPVEEKRVPLNCLVAPGTKKAMGDMREASGESNGEIVDRAVAALGGEIPVEEAVEVSKRPVSSVSVKASPNASGGFEPRKDGHCVHCGKDFELVPGAPPTSICRSCVVGGHRTGVDCRKCVEDAHYTKKAAGDSGALATGRTDIDFTTFND